MSPAGYGTNVEAGTPIEGLPGAGDDELSRPVVTPVPAPPDDQLIRLAKIGTILGAVGALILARWFHKNVEVRWRR